MVLVIIDGLDASGKSTQALRISSLLKKRGKSVYLRFHPSEDNFLGTQTKKFLYLKGKSAHFAAAFFYMLDVMRSILLYSWQKYEYVIFIRYLMGTSYLPSPLYIFVYNFFTCIVPTSDFMFFLDVTPKEAYKRILQNRKKQEMFENLEKLEFVRRKALLLTSMGKWTIINADKSIEDIEKDILRKLTI